MSAVKTKIDCFYHGKNHLSWDEVSIKYILNYMKVCDDCLFIIKYRFGLEKLDAVEGREPGQDG